MSVSLHTRPVSSSSNWNAAGNPIVYTFRREDNAITQVNDSGGFAQVQINGVDLTSYYQVGNSIVLMGASISVQNLYGTISASSFSGGNTLITTTVPFASIGVGADDFINNLSKRTDYKLEVEIFRSSDDTTLTNGVKLTYTHNRDGLMYVDVSIVKSFLSAEWSNPVSINEVDSQVSIKFYVKYQEYYDGALQGSVISDSANPIFAVFAAMQVGQSIYGGNMRDYYPNSDSKLWLTKFQVSSALKKLVMWRDWPFSLSFIHPDAIGTLTRIELRYDVAGSIIDSDRSTLSTANDDSINRLKFSTPADGVSKLVVQIGTAPAQPAGYTDSISVPDSSFASGVGGGAWVNTGSILDDAWSGGGGQVQVTPSPDSRILTPSVPISGSLRNRYIRLQFTADIPVGSNVVFSLYIQGASIGSSGIIAGNGSPTSYSIYGFAVGAALATSDLGLSVQLTSGLTPLIIVQDVTLTEGFLSKVFADTDIEVRDVCDYDANLVLVNGQNPIHLFWKNSLGGDSFWNFSKYHEYTYTYQNGRKAKRIILFENELHPVQWEAIQELNGTGEVYQTNIIELTSSVNKTSQRVGQQVYMISKDGATKTGVIVIPSTDRIFARDITDKTSIEIELPEVFQI